MPTTANLDAGTVMRASASLLNDTARTQFSYEVQVPYLNIALNELQELFEVNDIPVTRDTTTADAMPIDAGVTEVTFEPAVPVVGVTYLPDDFIEAKQIWERPRDINPYIPMTRRDILPYWQEGVENPQLIWWVWESQKIKFLPANQDNDIRINYTKRIFLPVEDEDSLIDVVNAQTFLEYRNAALIAEFISQDLTRAGSLNTAASGALDRALGIGTKGRQSIFTRRRPFRAGWKRTTYT